MFEKRTFLASCAVMIAVLVTGCGEDTTGRVTSTATPQRPTTSSSVPTTTAPPTTTRTTRATPPTKTPPPAPPTPARPTTCTTADLTVTLGAEEGTAGTIYRALVFTNTGQRTCVIQGFPGVSFVAGEDGHQVGQAAAWVGQKGPAITLKPGAAATASLGFTNIGAFDPEDCRPTPVRGLRIYPPHNKAAEFVPFPTTACAGTPPSNHLKVMSVHEGTGLN